MYQRQEQYAAGQKSRHQRAYMEKGRRGQEKQRAGMQECQPVASAEAGEQQRQGGKRTQKTAGMRGSRYTPSAPQAFRQGVKEEYREGRNSSI